MVRTLGIFLVAVLGALVSGCGGSNPKPSPVSSPSTSVSASPSGAPTMPAEAKGTTAASAEAFVRYYIDVFNYATKTGNTSSFRDLGTADCSSCQRLIARIESIYSGGGEAIGDLYILLSLKAKGRIVIGRLRQLPQRTIASPGAPQETAGTGTFRSQFKLRQIDGSWRMQDWSAL